MIVNVMRVCRKRERMIESKREKKRGGGWRRWSLFGFGWFW